MLSGIGALLIFALVMTAGPLRNVSTISLAAPQSLSAQVDDGPVSDDEPAVEDDDDGGGGVDDSEEPPEPADPSPTTVKAGTTPTTAAPAGAPTAAATAKPNVGKSLGDGTFLAPFTSADGVKTFRLTMQAVQWEVSAGKVFEAYTFNGVVPGPVIRVNEGDRIRVIVKNDLPISTGVHWHGMILPNSQDGIPGLTQKAIHPGETFTYTYTAIAAGTHWYHSHSSGADIGRGLYGALEVVPKDDFAFDRDYRLILGDTNLGFVLNGKAYPYTVPLAARVGEKVRFRIIAAGDLSHPIHLHGMTFDVVAQDGNPLKEPQKMDTLLVSAGQTFDIIATPTVAGRWLLHCHIFAHSHEAGEGQMHDMNMPVNGIAMGMNGLTTTLDVSPGNGVTPEALPATAPAELAASSDTLGGTPAEKPAIAIENSGSSKTGASEVALVGGVLLLAVFALYMIGQRRGPRKKEES